MMKRIFTLVNLTLLTLAAYFGASAFYVTAAEYFSTDPVQTKKEYKIDAAPKESYQPLSYYNAAVKRNLFKISKKKEAFNPVETKIETLEQTQLKLKLWGTVTSGGGSTYAVIEDLKTREQNLFQVGDNIQNARVKMVLREKIILNVDGKDEVLEIEDVVSGRGSAGRGLARSSVKLPMESPQEAEEEQITIKQSKIDTAVKNVNQLMKGARIRPHFTNGNPDGISLSHIRPGSIFTDIGLKSGDIIVGVDGETIESVDDALTLYSSLKSGTDVNLQIKRKGVITSINYSVEE